MVVVLSSLTGSVVAVWGVAVLPVPHHKVMMIMKKLVLLIWLKMVDRPIVET